MSRGLSVVVAGATGAVGREILSLLESRRFPVGRLRALASARSAGTRLSFAGDEVLVEPLETCSFAGVDVAFFSAGSERADHALRAAGDGALVIDNSSAFRLDPGVPLIVPEVNGAELDAAVARASGGGMVVANPNCCTILLVMALAPIECQVRIDRVVVSTYQAVSGTGRRAMEELDEQAEAARHGQPLRWEVYPTAIYDNVIPFVQAFEPGGATIEEGKIRRETRRLLRRPDLPVVATCVRVPVRRAHSEAVTLFLAESVLPETVRDWLSRAPGVEVWDDPAAGRFPTPRDAQGQDRVLVGRIRQDPDEPRSLSLWLTGDQLRKGAALNAIQIAEMALALRVSS